MLSNPPFGRFAQRRKLILWALTKVVAMIALLSVLTLVLTLVADTSWACRDYDGHRNWIVAPGPPCEGVVNKTGQENARASSSASAAPSKNSAGGETIHTVVAATWPADLVPEAEQIMFHEGSGIVSDGYCGWGIIPSTAAAYDINTASSDPYYCSEQAYRIYRDAGGFSPWTTAGWYDPAAPSTPITY